MLLYNLLEKNESKFTILQQLKKYKKKCNLWIAYAWDNTTKGAIQNSSKNLWRTLEYVETTFIQVKDCHLLLLMKEIQ